MPAIVLPKKKKINYSSRTIGALDKAIPANRGLIFWLIAQPWQFNSSKWIDVVNGFSGSMSNIGNNNSVSGWNGTYRPNGTGEMRFDGVDDVVDFGDRSLAQGVNKFSVSLWFRAFVGTSNVDRVLFSYTAIAGKATFSLYIARATGSAKLTFLVTNDSTSVLVLADVNFNSVAWNHVAGVYDGNNVSLYFNGTKQSNPLGLTGPTVNNAGILRVANSSAFYGAMDDIRIYGRALERHDIFDLYARSSTTSAQLYIVPNRTYFFPAPSSGQSVTISASQMAWQANALPQTHSFFLSPSSMAWQANTLPQTRSFLVSPSQEAWQTQTPEQRSSLRLSPAQMAWMTQTPDQRSSVILSPSQMAWQANTPLQTRGYLLSPSQMAWMAQTLLQTRGYAITPAQMAWQANTPLQTRSFAITPAQMAWKASVLGTSGALLITITPAQMAWMTQTLLQTRGYAITPAQMAWQANSPRQTVSFGITPTQMAWQAQQLVLASALRITPAQMAWQANMLRLGISMGITPSQMAWQAQALTQTRALRITPAQMSWQAQALQLARSFGITPSQMAWQAQALTLGNSLLVRPGQMAWQAQTGLIPKFIIISPSQMGWQAQQLTLTAIDLGVTPFQLQASPVFLVVDEESDPIFLGFI